MNATSISLAAERGVPLARDGQTGEMPAYTWDVLIPGEDVPQRITTEYIVSEGEEINAGGRTWTVERVAIDESVESATGIVSVVPPREPTSSPPPSSGPPPPR